MLSLLLSRLSRLLLKLRLVEFSAVDCNFKKKYENISIKSQSNSYDLYQFSKTNNLIISDQRLFHVLRDDILGRKYFFRFFILNHRVKVQVNQVCRPFSTSTFQKIKEFESSKNIIPKYHQENKSSGGDEKDSKRSIICFCGKKSIYHSQRITNNEIIGFAKLILRSQS